MKNTHKSQTEKSNEDAKRRWSVLVNALNTRGRRRPFRNLSIVKHDSFNLFDIRPLTNLQTNDDATWYLYTRTSNTAINVEIFLPSSPFSIEELTGFNNTGNVRIWPSEEVLAYMVLKHGSFFENKTVLEVGGGMTCLAGVLLARHVQCQSVHLTDGNSKAIANVKKIIKRNTFKCVVTCDILLWNKHTEHPVSYDVILAADCLFFSESRIDLIHLMARLLKENGVILITAPKRGDTLCAFEKEARAIGFTCSVHHYYDEYLWSQHSKLKENKEYVEEDQYPVLLVLQKSIGLQNSFCLS